MRQERIAIGFRAPRAYVRRRQRGQEGCAVHFGGARRRRRRTVEGSRRTLVAVRIPSRPKRRSAPPDSAAPPPHATRTTQPATRKPSNFAMTTLRFASNPSGTPGHRIPQLVPARPGLRGDERDVRALQRDRFERPTSPPRERGLARLRRVIDEAREALAVPWLTRNDASQRLSARRPRRQPWGSALEAGPLGRDLHVSDGGERRRRRVVVDQRQVDRLRRAPDLGDDRDPGGPVLVRVGRRSIPRARSRAGGARLSPSSRASAHRAPRWRQRRRRAAPRRARATARGRPAAAPRPPASSGPTSRRWPAVPSYRRSRRSRRSATTSPRWRSR